MFYIVIACPETKASIVQAAMFENIPTYVSCSNLLPRGVWVVDVFLEIINGWFSFSVYTLSREGRMFAEYLRLDLHVFVMLIPTGI